MEAPIELRPLLFALRLCFAAVAQKPKGEFNYCSFGGRRLIRIQSAAAAAKSDRLALLFINYNETSDGRRRTSYKSSLGSRRV